MKMFYLCYILFAKIGEVQMEKNEIAIVGGAGFVGSRLSARFKAGNVNFKRYDSNTCNQLDRSVFLDVEDLSSLEYFASAGAIINLAAVHRDDVRP